MSFNKLLDQGLEKTDPEIFEIINQEVSRQQNNLELIASENIASQSVMKAQGSVLTNKYAEGLPSKRYYGGCKFVDQAEELARERAKKLFKAQHVNVQPHSGAQANFAVMLSVLSPGDQILGMSLDQGGHLTHGSPVNFSGKWFKVSHYGINENGLLDYQKIREQALSLKPKLIIAGASAYPREINFKLFGEIARESGAYLLADISHISGLVSTGLHTSPIKYADFVTTTTHKTLRGPRGGIILSNNSDLFKKIDSAVFPGSQGGPLMHVIAAKAVAFKEALEEDFQIYQKQILKNTQALAQELIKEKIELVSGGSDNHLVLINLVKEALNGKQAEELLESVYLTCNKNAVPNDPEKPWVSSGIRLGTPACTTRGLKEPEFRIIARVISSVIKTPESHKAINESQNIVRQIIERFPIY